MEALGWVMHGYLWFEANLPRRIKPPCLAPAAMKCRHIYSELETFAGGLVIPDDPQLTRAHVDFPRLVAD